jgi:hypothetical protein
MSSCHLPFYIIGYQILEFKNISELVWYQLASIKYTPNQCVFPLYDIKIWEKSSKIIEFTLKINISQIFRLKNVENVNPRKLCTQSMGIILAILIYYAKGLVPLNTQDFKHHLMVWNLF